MLYLGEAIIDEYQYCESIGKSGKEPVLAVRLCLGREVCRRSVGHGQSIGRLLRSHRHAHTAGHQGFARGVHPRETQSQDRNVVPVHGRGAHDRQAANGRNLSLQKLFEVYFMDQEVPEAVNKALYARLQAILPRYDAVVVTDYGHGVLTPEIIELLCGSDRFLAVNTQTNAANQGFNSPSKYARADFLCLSEKELRLEVRNRTKDLRLIVAEAAERLSCKQMLVTRGRSGNLCYHAKEGFFTIPSFTTRIVDRVGAGDALLAVASLCAAKDVPMEVTGFIGNAVGAQAVETVGNRSVITPEALARQINDMMSYDHWIST